MENQRPKNLIHLDQNRVYKAGSAITARREGDFTLFNLGEVAQMYKLRDGYARVRQLEYRSNRKLKLQTFQEYARIRTDLHLRTDLLGETRPRPSYPADEAYRNTRQPFLYFRGDMLVLVDKAIYPQVAARIDQYVLDVGRDGYWATIHVIDGGTPQQIASYIHRRSPVGALLVGAIAAPWYDQDGDQFPCDLYYMDTNGTWTDPDNDGKFEQHSGDVDAEIWIGRIYTPTNDGRDVTLINDYFDRNHQFRLGRLGHAFSGMAYVDDPWLGFNDCALDEVFPSSQIRCYTDPIQTDADLYKAEVNSLRSWVQVCAHSWPQGHAFTVGAQTEYVDSSYFRDINPPNAHFYNLFSCGPGRYTENDYLGGWYIFDKSGGGRNNGLAAIASAKSGSMLFFEDFYRPLGQGYCIGDALVQWWQARGAAHSPDDIHWFYGLVLLGDPTLTWWKGNVPQQVQPQPEDVFNHWPRQMQLRWEPVDIPGLPAASVTYTVEIDAFGMLVVNKWAEAVNGTPYRYTGLTQTSLDHSFVGAQRGRWRVQAVVNGRACSWSPWSYFRFTV